jgi:hypothetical protein
MGPDQRVPRRPGRTSHPSLLVMVGRLPPSERIRAPLAARDHPLQFAEILGRPTRARRHRRRRGRLAAGGTYDRLFYPATVLAGVAPTAPGFTEEIFGPVAPVLKYSTVDEAVRIAADTEYGPF